MEDAGELVPVTDLHSLDKHLQNWNSGIDSEPRPIGYVRSLEGADSIVTLKYLEKAYSTGLRAIGPAHYGPRTVCAGHGCNRAYGWSGAGVIKRNGTTQHYPGCNSFV